jgi:hypothetical protein
MRVYWTTTVARTEAIFRDGFTDLYEEFGREGVYFATQQLDALDGFDGDVTLCLDLPPEVFDEYDLTDDLQRESGYRVALIPATVLNGLGKPQVYDHEYAGCSRRDLVRGAKSWEADDDDAAEGEDWNGGGRADAYQQHAQELRHAVEFFDRIGWLTPLKLKEEGAG